MVHSNRIANSMPDAMKSVFLNMNPSSKTKFLLSGLNSSYTGEWALIYQRIVEFIYEMYQERFKLYQLTLEQIPESPP